ncbi:MAG TPA: hypothetical protein VFN57_13605 [Thermomicrobiaceae bacterium]|nr:hypothetical protein [Thermomicrobiaceae bacterium]
MSNSLATYTRAVLQGLVVTGLVAVLGLWARRLNLQPGSIPIYDAAGRAYWLAGLGLALLAGVVAQVLDREASFALATAEAREIRYEPVSELPTGWIFPAAATFAAVTLLAIYHRPSALTGILAGLFLVLSAGIAARHYLFVPDEALRQRARGVYTILIHVVAFVSLAMVYLNKVRSLFSATTVLLLGLALLLQLTEGEDVLFGRRLVYALAGGILLGEVTWVLNYWRATGWTGGATLLIFFYLAAGLIAAQVRRGIEARDVAEYAGISALAFGIVIYSMLR